jgi:hypothetical protein
MAATAQEQAGRSGSRMPKQEHKERRHCGDNPGTCENPPQPTTPFNQKPARRLMRANCSLQSPKRVWTQGLLSYEDRWPATADSAR